MCLETNVLDAGRWVTIRPETDAFMSASDAKHLLLVDGDEVSRTALANYLRMTGEFTVTETGSGGEALDLAVCEPFDAVLLDLQLPDVDGHELCKCLRRRGVRIPIVLTSSISSDSDVVLGLNCGANDYVARPFRFAVLLARLRAHLRQHEQNHATKFMIGRYEFLPGGRTLVDSELNIKIRLTEKETAILRYLYERREVVVARSELLRDVWGYHVSVTTHTVETHIHRLRKKIGADPSNAQLILTEGQGYRLDF